MLHNVDEDTQIELENAIDDLCSTVEMFADNDKDLFVRVMNEASHAFFNEKTFTYNNDEAKFFIDNHYNHILTVNVTQYINEHVQNTNLDTVSKLEDLFESHFQEFFDKHPELTF